MLHQSQGEQEGPGRVEWGPLMTIAPTITVEFRHPSSAMIPCFILFATECAACDAAAGQANRYRWSDVAVERASDPASLRPNLSDTCTNMSKLMACS